MSVRKNVFVVLTEYQFLQALNIATSIYNSIDYTNQICLIRNGARLQGIDRSRVSKSENIEIQIFENEKPRKLANLILDENPDHFLFFQAGSALNVHIAHTLSKKGTEISLGPDGYGTYAVFNKKNHLLSIIKDSIKENIFLIKNELFKGKIHRFDYYRYGNHHFINNLWITHPEKYVHHAKNKVNILKLPDFNAKCIELIRICFDFNVAFPTEDVIYFFNQPLWSPLADKEFNFLKSVVANFPGKKVIVKLHPLTDLQTKVNYQALDGLEIIESSVPAEVLLLSLKKCIVFTGWSSVLITENKSCNYYFNYPIFKEMNDPVLNQINLVVLDHITMVHSPQEMKFPNE